MCNITTFQILMVTSDATLLVAATFVLIAAYLSRGFFKTSESPWIMLVASIIYIGAAIELAFVISEVNACVGSCSKSVTNLQNALLGLTTIVGIQVTSCLLVSLVRWCPRAFGWLAEQIPGYGVIGALVIEVVLLPYILFESAGLIKCVGGASTGFMWGTFIVTIIAIVAGIIASIFIAIR